MIRSITFLALALSLTGFGPCSQRTSPPAPPAADGTLATSPAAGMNLPSPSRPSAAQQTPSTSELMRQHARAARTMRAAVIAGQLDEARRAASEIASDEWTPHLQLNHSLYVSAVRSAARTVQASKSLTDAAEGLGEVGATCAACHRNVRAPSTSWAVSTSEGSNPSMTAHARAEQALWDGLVNSSDASWSRGARELLEAPELDSDDEETSLLARRTRDHAREAARATSTRGDVYGRIVATCSSCHLSRARKL